MKIISSFVPVWCEDLRNFILLLKECFASAYPETAIKITAILSSKIFENMTSMFS